MPNRRDRGRDHAPPLSSLSRLGYGRKVNLDLDLDLLKFSQCINRGVELIGFWILRDMMTQELEFIADLDDNFLATPYVSQRVRKPARL